MSTQSGIRYRLILAAFVMSGWSATALAQSEKRTDADKNTVNVKIIERTNDGEVRELERSYRLNGMGDDERDALVNRLVDSIRTKRGDKKGQITITIDENDSHYTYRRDDRPNRLNRPSDRPLKHGDITARRPNRPSGPSEFRYYRDGKLQNRYRFDTDSLVDRLKRFEFSWPENFGQRMEDSFRSWNRSLDEGSKASTIRSLQVYPNNPETNQLNIRFTAPAKGDIRIRVTTPDGKEVAKKDVKDFSGSYAGQIDIDRKAKGVYFVNVTQNDDGAVKRVVIP
ncbi:putative secreted protein (Por secretion system target) [Larkinella arboricola]|uniref:Putative secreted protein (Por secretion system target) n=1 Tax=Larkinella arboricola TaxID=643671 RepID=A0A327WZB7_LARAB|nr:T9SS type A sorting domain-containing protein [Larkinella arboricola]RAJ97755.1 putative secreted protein (Por secretion system target) [Larkinella arboricola]